MHKHRWSGCFVLAGALGALSACNAGGSSTPLTAAPQSVIAFGHAPVQIPPALARIMPRRAGLASGVRNARLHGWLSPRAMTGKNIVYVASDDSSTGAVYLYTTGGQGQAPIGAIVDGVAGPAGIAVDSGGSLYVANSGANTVTVYPPGKLSPSTTYTDGISAPQGVAVGSDGTVYVANETGSPSGAGSVTEYAPGSMSPSKTITLAGMYAFAVGVNASNKLYVSWFDLSSYAVQMYKYASGSTKGTNLNLDLPAYVFPVFAIAFDHSGNLVIPVESLDHNPPKYIEFFPPGATEPSRKIDEAGLVDVVEGIAFPKSSRLFYVASANDHDWMKLTMHKVIPRDVVQVAGPWGLALSP